MGRRPGRFPADCPATTTTTTTARIPFRAGVSGLDRDREYLVDRRTGNRSGSAVKVMEEPGFGNVFRLDGGIVKWKAAGLPSVG